MTEVQPGDAVFSFSDTYIKAIGIATGPAQSAPKPDFGSAGAYWDNDGWLVPVEFKELQKPVRPKDFIDEFIPFLPTKYSPIRPDGGGNQVYLAEISNDMAGVILRQAGVDTDSLRGAGSSDDDTVQAEKPNRHRPDPEATIGDGEAGTRHFQSECPPSRARV